MACAACSACSKDACYTQYIFLKTKFMFIKCARVRRLLLVDFVGNISLWPEALHKPNACPYITWL